MEGAAISGIGGSRKINANDEAIDRRNRGEILVTERGQPPLHYRRFLRHPRFDLQLSVLACSLARSFSLQLMSSLDKCRGTK